MSKRSCVAISQQSCMLAGVQLVHQCKGPTVEAYGRGNVYGGENICDGSSGAAVC